MIPITRIITAIVPNSGIIVVPIISISESPCSKLIVIILEFESVIVSWYGASIPSIIIMNVSSVLSCFFASSTSLGISNEIESCITKKISIPRFGDLQTTESLNVATAAAIFLSEFKRR